MKYKNRQNQSMVMKSDLLSLGGTKGDGELTGQGYRGVFHGDGMFFALFGGGLRKSIQ